MSALYMYATKISVCDMKQFLKNVGLSFDYLILEFYDKVIFEKFDLSFLDDEKALNRGRAFNNEYEIKWRRKGENFLVALTAEDLLNDEVAQKFEDGLLKVNYAKRCEPEEGFLLWGEYLDKVEVNGKLRHRWFELRIPKPQFYPVDAPLPYVRLKTADYYDNQGRMIARRLIKPCP